MVIKGRRKPRAKQSTSKLKTLPRLVNRTKKIKAIKLLFFKTETKFPFYFSQEFLIFYKTADKRLMNIL